ncbi:MAG: GNAT family N-acetyltransferase, partial [candidate division FCPU426 bacterium]
MDKFELKTGGPLSDTELNALFSASWPGLQPRAFQPILVRSLTYVSARNSSGRLLGFVNLAWDGGLHGFLLD